MLPYLHVPISLPGIDDKGDKTVTARLLPQHVQFYHEGYAWGTFIYCQNGHALCSSWTVSEYEEAVKDYWQRIEKDIKQQSKTVKLFQ